MRCDLRRTAQRSVDTRLIVLSEVPFADQTGLVANFLKAFDSEGLCERQTGLRAGRKIGFVAKAFLVTSRHQTGPGGRANSARNIGLGKARSRRSNTIDMGSQVSHVWSNAFLEAKIGITGIVREENDYIGFVSTVAGNGAE